MYEYIKNYMGMDPYAYFCGASAEEVEPEKPAKKPTNKRPKGYKVLYRDFHGQILEPYYEEKVFPTKKKANEFVKVFKHGCTITGAVADVHIEPIE